MPDLVEPCERRIEGAGGCALGLACLPRWNSRLGAFVCDTCEARVLIMVAVEQDPNAELRAGLREACEEQGVPMLGPSDV